jgi:hypothetical protein
LYDLYARGSARADRSVAGLSPHEALSWALVAGAYVAFLVLSR